MDQEQCTPGRGHQSLAIESRQLFARFKHSHQQQDALQQVIAIPIDHAFLCLPKKIIARPFLHQLLILVRVPSHLSELGLRFQSSMLDAPHQISSASSASFVPMWVFLLATWQDCWVLCCLLLLGFVTLHPSSRHRIRHFGFFRFRRQTARFFAHLSFALAREWVASLSTCACMEPMPGTNICEHMCKHVF